MSETPPAELMRRLLAGEQLTDGERATLLASATPRPAHRPARYDLSVVNTELMRVLHFLDARLANHGYDDAIDAASNASAISGSRIKGALTWFSKTTGTSWQEALSFAQRREQRNARIEAGGIDALTPNEILNEGLTLAFADEMGKRPKAKRAALFLRHPQDVKECIARIWDRSVPLFESLINDNPGAVNSLGDFARLLNEVATSIAKDEVQKLDHLMN